MIKQFVIQENSRLDVQLSKLMEQTRSNISNLIERGKVRQNGELVTKAGAKAFVGNIVEVEIAEAVESQVVAQDIPIEIVYQDNDVVVINKQQGLVVHPASGNYSNTLVNALLFHIKDLSGINGVIRPGIVHRLDKDTSGLMIVCKNDKAHVNIAKQIANKDCRRVYWALVEGVVKSDEGIIDMPIARSSSDRKRMAIDSHGRNAVTFYKVLKRFSSNTLVEFELKTGRTHQIRVHSCYLKHPVVGDAVYGFKHQKFNLEGQLLHSKTISFTHPSTGRLLTFESELPNYFQSVLNKLK